MVSSTMKVREGVGGLKEARVAVSRNRDGMGRGVRISQTSWLVTPPGRKRTRVGCRSSPETSPVAVISLRFRLSAASPQF
jgi:hypothetical protein